MFAVPPNDPRVLATSGGTYRSTETSTRRRWRTFHPLLNSLVQGKGGRRDTSLKRASLRLPRFFFFLSCSPTAFLLSLATTARKPPCPRRSPIDFDRLPRPPLKQLRLYGGIRERRNNKTHHIMAENY